MTWVAVAVGVGGAVVGYVGQQQTNKTNADIAKKGGRVDTTTTRSPDDYSAPYRQGALDSAWGALTGQSPLSGGQAAPIQGEPNASGGGTRSKPPAGYRYNAAGKLVQAKNPAPGVGGGSAAGGGGAGGGLPSTVAGKGGQSASTSSIIGRMEGLPGQNANMNGVAEKYSTDLLQGNSSNPLLDPATAAAQNVGQDPRLSAFEDYLMGDLGVGGGQATAGGSSGRSPTFNYNGYVSSGAGGPGGGGGYGGSSPTGAQTALQKLIAGQDPAGWADMQKAISDQVNASRAESLRNLKGQGVAGGFYGGSGFDSMEAQAVAAGDQQLANQLAGARFGAFQNALGLGTQYDLGMADVAARNYATSSSAGSAAASLAAAQRAQTLGALGDALKLGEEGRYGTATNLGSLANLFSGDQKTALGGISDLAASRRGDLSAAGQLSLGSDQTQNSLRAAGIAANTSRSIANNALNWQKQQFYDPLSRIGQFNDILNGDFGAYGTEHTQGTDTRAAGGGGAVSPFSAALGGAAIGGQIGSMYNRQQQPQGGYDVTGGGFVTGPTSGGVW